MDVTLTERNIVLVAHVMAAVMFLGPVTVAISLFPRYALLGETAVAAALHRITRGYGLASLAIPAFGLYLAARLELFGLLWINLSLGLFGVGIVLLIGIVVPTQQRLLHTMTSARLARADVARLRALSGLYGLTWLIVLYLMIAKPG